MALPTRGQPDWDDELGNHISGLEAEVQSAVANASQAISNANEARNVAQSVRGAVLGGSDAANAALINDSASATATALSATIAGDITDAYDTDPGALAVRPSTATPAATVADPGGIRYPGWMSRDRSTIFNLSGVPTVNYSLDNGATWLATNASLPAGGVQAVRDLADGEILVSAGTSPGKLYRSSGWSTNKQTATFTEVLSASVTGAYFHNSYGLWADESGLILAGEYGPKTANANARYVYMSRDFGVTWTTILDIGGTVETHVHGVAYDKWWNRIWVSRGDATRAIYYSDDFGATWQTVSAYNTTMNSASQCKVTTIHPMPGCVLFMSDSAPNGVLRIRRKRKSNPVVEVAYQLDSSTSITHIGQLAYQANLPGAPVLMSFTNDPAAGYTGPGRLVATVDGFRFYELWKDSINYGTSGGLIATVGPTTDGKYLGTLNDGRQARYSKLTITAPTWDVQEAPRPGSAIGDETMPRVCAVTQPVPQSGTLVLSYFQATQTKDVTTIRAYTSGTAAAATTTLFRLGLYEEDGSGNLALIAGGTNDVTKIQTTYNNVAQTIAARTVAGRRYAVGLLAVGPGQMPTLAGTSSAGGTQLPSGAFFLDPKLSAQVAGQTDLPASIAVGSLVTCARIFWHAVV